MDFKEAFLRRKIFDIRGIKISVASIDDLIRLKSIAGRPRDRDMDWLSEAVVFVWEAKRKGREKFFNEGGMEGK